MCIQSFIYIIVYIYVQLIFADPDMVFTGFRSYLNNSHQIIDII